MVSESYFMGVKIGSARAGYRILEDIIKEKFKEEYKIYKYRMRRLSETEISELITKSVTATDISEIRKYIG